MQVSCDGWKWIQDSIVFVDLLYPSFTWEIKCCINPPLFLFGSCVYWTTGTLLQSSMTSLINSLSFKRLIVLSLISPGLTVSIISFLERTFWMFVFIFRYLIHNLTEYLYYVSTHIYNICFTCYPLVNLETKGSVRFTRQGHFLNEFQWKTPQTCYL